MFRKRQFSDHTWPQEDLVLSECSADDEEKTTELTQLQCANALLTAESSHLSASITQLEEQVLALEAENGRLKSQSIGNDALKAQLQQLQKDVSADTALRKELIEKLDSTKRSLEGRAPFNAFSVYFRVEPINFTILTK